ncbi:MAG: hypothetical protein ACI4LX_01845 [Treponema sp.]
MKEETKEKAKGLIEKVKGALDKGLNASKKALGIAGEAVQDFSDKSALRIEKKQLESKLKKQYELIGEYAAAAFLSKKNVSLTSKDRKISEFLAEVSRIQKEIDIRKDALENEDSRTDKNEKVSDADFQVKEKKSAPKKTSATKPSSAKTAAKSSKTASAPAKKTASKTAAASSSAAKPSVKKTSVKSASAKKTEKK